MAKQELTKEKLQKMAYRELRKIVKDPETSASVKTQALTQLVKLAEQLPASKTDELAEFLNEEK